MVLPGTLRYFRVLCGFIVFKGYLGYLKVFKGTFG